MQPFLISIAEAAKALSLGKTAFYQLLGQGRIDTIKIGRRRLVKVESIHQLLVGHR